MEETPPSQPPNVRKVKRADLEAALDEGALEEVRPAPSAEADLSPLQEMDLARELAALADEIESAHEEALEVESKKPSIPRPSANEALLEEEESTREPRPEAMPASEARVDRLMSEAEAKMDDPDTVRRRDTFAHLKAAVAVTKAELGLAETGDGSEVDPATVAYREDFDDASQADKSRRAAPVPPFQLVAAMRIGKSEAKEAPEAPEPREAEAPESAVAAPVSPVRPAKPTRVKRAVPEPEEAAPEELTAYLEEKGASSLAEKMEVVAAFLMDVEKHQQFTRPQVVGKLRDSGHGDFSRDEMLKAFESLANDGTFTKVAAGRYALDRG